MIHHADHAKIVLSFFFIIQTEISLNPLAGFLRTMSHRDDFCQNSVFQKFIGCDFDKVYMHHLDGKNRSATAPLVY